MKYCGFTLYRYDSESPEDKASEDESGGTENGNSSNESKESSPSEPEITFTDLLEDDNAPSENDIFDEYHGTSEKCDVDHAASYEKESIDAADDNDVSADSDDEQSLKDSIPESDTPKTESSKDTEDNETDNDTDNEKEKESLKQRWEDIKPFIPIGKKGLKKLLKLIRIRNLELHLKVGGDDPYAAGMNFAKANQAFYPALALLCTVFSVTVKKAEIKCDYYKKELDASGSVMVLARPSAIICLVIYLAVNYLIITRRQKKEQNNNSKKDIKEGNEDE